LGALTGIRVTEFSVGLAGPVCVSLLAEMGAEVIEIESRKYLNFTRALPDPVTYVWDGPDSGWIFNDTNFNKLGMTLDLKKPEGIALAKELIKISDIVVESFTPGVMDRLGLGYEELRKIKPDIIMFSSSAMGQKGPEASYRGYAPLFAALVGLGDLIGYTDGPPSEVRFSTDIISAYYGVIPIMNALIHRQKTGEGQYIDYSTCEALDCLIGDSILAYKMNGVVLSRTGNEDACMAPHNCYRCRGEDKWISIAISNDEEWEAFCSAIGEPEWTREERFSTQLGRWQNRHELDRMVETWTTNYDFYEAMDILQGAGVAGVPSFSSQDIFTDPHLRERDVFMKVEHPKMGVRNVLKSPWRMSATPPKVERRSPLLGEHNEYVLGQLLGMSESRINELREIGALD
jgi:benzylsuccinate CoA-transferase BbsF subunit